MIDRTFDIRRATIDDLDALLPLVQAYRVFYEQAPDGPRARAFMTRHLGDSTGIVFMARQLDEAVGFVQLFQTFSTVYLGPALILEDLYVAPAARRSGLAARLLETAMAHAREIDAVGMFLETAIDNVAAQRVYESAGWVREGHFLKYNAPL